MSESDLFGLKDTHVVITGASGGIGLATVKLFAKLGAKITAQCNSKTGGLENCGPAVNTLQADSTNEEQVELFFKYAGEFRGPPHVLVGIPPSSPS
jgi:NAD(P)-dependent dehydrogenase (short-subunit alcohol dehydrogenase family)